MWNSFGKKTFSLLLQKTSKLEFYDLVQWFPEIGTYRDNLSAIVIDDNLLSIIIIAQNNFDLSITVIAFVIYFVIADKLSR